MSRLANKIILVTGSTTGIGKAIAHRCLIEGAAVVLHGLEQTWGEALVEEWDRQFAGRVSFCQADLEAETQPRRLIEFAIAQHQRLDAIVNNAAIVSPGDLQSTDAAYLRRMFAVNTIAPFLLIQTALPHLSQSGGCVLNIGSVNAYCGEADLLPYSMSKGALMTMTRNLGDTLMRECGVRVNQINPGWVLTENETQRKHAQGLSTTWYQDLPKQFAPAGRILQPNEIAAAAIYWLSEECGPISGQVVELEQYPMIGRNPPKDGTTLK